MRVELVQAIILACNLHVNVGDNRGADLAKLASAENMCVMSVGVCVRNKELECSKFDAKKLIATDKDCEYGLILLNCVTQKREWKN